MTKNVNRKSAEIHVAVCVQVLGVLLSDPGSDLAHFARVRHLRARREPHRINFI